MENTKICRINALLFGVVANRQEENKKNYNSKREDLEEEDHKRDERNVIQ